MLFHSAHPTTVHVYNTCVSNVIVTSRDAKRGTVEGLSRRAHNLTIIAHGWPLIRCVVVVTSWWRVSAELLTVGIVDNFGTTANNY